MSPVLIGCQGRKSYETGYVEKESEMENCDLWNMLFIHVLEYNSIDK